MLLNVPNPKIRMFLDFSQLRDEFSGQKFDESRLASAVTANYGSPGRKGEGTRGVNEGRLQISRVRVRDIGHTKDGACLRFDTCQDTWRRKLELGIGCRQCIVTLGLRLHLNKAVKEVRCPGSCPSDNGCYKTYSARLPL